MIYATKGFERFITTNVIYSPTQAISERMKQTKFIEEMNQRNNVETICETLNFKNTNIYIYTA